MNKITLTFPKYHAQQESGRGTRRWYVVKSAGDPKGERVLKDGLTMGEAKDLAGEWNDAVGRHMLDSGLSQARRALAEWVAATTELEVVTEPEYVRDFNQVRAQLKTYLSKCGFTEEELGGTNKRVGG